MDTLSQRDYVVQVKNSMLLHFGHKEICSTLKDVNELFASGKEYGKSEEELCDEFGQPEEFAAGLLWNSHRDKFFGRLFLYIAAAVAAGIFTAYIFDSLNPLHWCIPAVIFPVYVWHLCGGSCLHELYYHSYSGISGHEAAYAVCGIAASVLVMAQQVWAVLLGATERIIPMSILSTVLLAVYYLSMAAVLFFIQLSVLMIYRLYHGAYLSISALLMCGGVIWSSFSYIIYVKSFNGPNAFSSACSLPYILSMVLATGFFLYGRRNRLRRKLIHRSE